MVTVKVRSAGWSLMDTRLLRPALSDPVVSTIFHGDKHEFLHQYLLFFAKFSAY